MSASRRIEKLRRDHAVETFDGGRAELNQFLSRYAYLNQLAQTSQTYVGLSGDRIVGFYTLITGAVAHEGRHPIPILVLARLVLDKNSRGQGMGRSLLKDALRRTLQASDLAGIRALTVHALDEAAKNFYSHFNFIPSPSDPRHLFLPLKDVKRLLDQPT